MTRMVVFSLLVVGLMVGVPGVVGDDRAPQQHIVDVCATAGEITGLFDEETCEDAIDRLKICVKPGRYTLEDLRLAEETGTEREYYFAIPITHRSNTVGDKILPDIRVEYNQLVHFIFETNNNIISC